MATEPLIIDCDPGQDDAVALLLAVASPEVELLTVTTVAGNVPLAHTSANARRVLELAGRPDIPVYAGCERPLVREPVTAEYVHGETGLDGAGLPPPSTELAEGHAAVRISHTTLSTSSVAAGRSDIRIDKCSWNSVTPMMASGVMSPRTVRMIAAGVAARSPESTQPATSPSPAAPPSSWIASRRVNRVG